MARDHARVNVSIWGSSKFRALTPQAQHLYFVLVTSSSLSYAGVADWRPKRLAALAGGWTVEAVESAAAELHATRTVLIDPETEEALIRSWVKWDGLINQPRMAVSVANAYADTASSILRGVIVHELRKLREAQPDLPGWAKSKLLEVLGEVQFDPSETPNYPQSEVVFGPNQTSPTPAPSPAPPPSPAPSPIGEGGVGGTLHPETPSGETTHRPPEKQSGKRRSQSPIPEDWSPTESHQQRAEELGLDVHTEADRFVNHALSKGRRLVDWDAGFRNWLAQEVKYAQDRKSRPQFAPKGQAKEDANLANLADWVQSKQQAQDALPFPGGDPA